MPGLGGGSSTAAVELSSCSTAAASAPPAAAGTMGLTTLGCRQRQGLMQLFSCMLLGAQLRPL